MIDLKKIQTIIQKRQGEKNIPKHLLINLDSKEDLKVGERIIDLMNFQTERNIPILTLGLSGLPSLKPGQFLDMIESIKEKSNKFKVSISIIGRWYSLAGEVVENLKRMMEESSDYDSYFLNLCINYDPQQEIADACRVIIKKVQMEKEDADKVTPELIKENIYSSYFLSPDLIIEPYSRFTGTFLWDSAGSLIYLMNKADFAKPDLVKALDWYAEH